MEKTFDEDDNSLPKLPDMSVGSSVSTDMENEYNDLLQYTLVLPAKFDEPRIGPQVLENCKGLFSTTSILSKIEEKSTNNSTPALKEESPRPKENPHPEQIEFVETKVETQLETNEQEQEKNQKEQKDEESNKHLAEEDNTTPTSTDVLLLQSINNKNLNSITIVSDLVETNTSTNQVYKHQLEDLKETLATMNASFSSPSSTSSSSSSNSQDQCDLLMNQYFNNYQQTFDTSNDVNPRKNSPIPASPPTNLDLENEPSSLEHLSSLNNFNFDTNSAFRKVNIERNSHSHVAPIVDTSANQFPILNRLTNSNQTKLVSNQNETIKNVKIATCLDKWYKELKGQVLSEFEKSRVQILHEQQKKLIDEKEKQTIEISKLKKEIEILKETIKMHERNTLKKDEAIENVSKAFEKQREKNELQRVMMEWKLKRLENAKETFTSKLADKYYAQRLKLKAFLSWQCFLINKHKAKVEKACKKKAEEVCYDLATKYESKIKKLEEELNVSKLEIEKYKLEMAKHEENMKKALMRGVCALNLEAMSIFNENSSTSGSKTSLNNEEPIPTLQNQFLSSFNNLQNLEPKPLSNSLTELSMNRKLSEKESRELARKVKNYCESSLSTKKSSNSNNSQVNGQTSAMSAVAKAKMQLLNSKNNNLEQKNEETHDTNQKFVSNNKIFDELTEHPSLQNSKTGSVKHSNVKSKVGSLPISSKNQPPNGQIMSSTMPPYRSVIIEKHTNNNPTQTSTTISETTTKVKYTPPMQPAKVLNTVISSS